MKLDNGSECVHLFIKHDISNTLEWIIHPRTKFQQSITKTERPNQGAVMFFYPDVVTDTHQIVMRRKVMTGFDSVVVFEKGYVK